MSKAYRSRQREKRDKAKRLRKLQNKSIYEERMRQGVNSKSYRSRQNNKVAARKKKLVSHPEGPCGNIGCKRCDPAGIHHK